MFGILFSVCIHGLFGSLRAVPIRSKSPVLKLRRILSFRSKGLTGPGRRDPQIVRHAFIDVDTGRGHEDAHRIGSVSQDVGNLQRWLCLCSAQGSCRVVVLETGVGIHGLDEIALGWSDLLRHGELQTFPETINGVDDNRTIDEVARETGGFAGARLLVIQILVNERIRWRA